FIPVALRACSFRHLVLGWASVGEPLRCRGHPTARFSCSVPSHRPMAWAEPLFSSAPVQSPGRPPSEWFALDLSTARCPAVGGSPCVRSKRSGEQHRVDLPLMCL